MHATCSRDYTNDQRIAPNGVAPPNKNLHIYTQMEVFAKIVNGLKPLTIPAKGPSWMFDSVLNTPLVRL